LKPIGCSVANLAADIAPITGARIETVVGMLVVMVAIISPPSRGRGLKQVAVRSKRPLVVSPPSRGRGLKPTKADLRDWLELSPPSRGRGLKPLFRAMSKLLPHRPHHGGAD